MPNIAQVLKAEITRLARKEIRQATDRLKKAGMSQRSENVALRRRVDELEREVRALRRLSRTPDSGDGRNDEAASAPFRFSAKGLAAQRRRLALSASECGVLLNASAQSIYNWESGVARPRAAHMPAIQAMRKLGKRQAASILEFAGKNP